MELQETITNLTTDITGKGNTLALPKSVKLQRTRLFIDGSNNQIIIGENTLLKNLFIEFKGSNNKLIIGDDCKILGHILIKGNSQKVAIGNKTTFQYNCYLLSQEGKNITIGDDCMFSNNIDVRTTDAHSILDAETGTRKNEAKDISIGNHVWVSAKSLISKGSIIPDNCIIGGSAVVTKKFEHTNCTIAGSPAKVVSTGVTWDRKLI